MATPWTSETHGDVRIDSLLAEMARHHTTTQAEFDDVIAFLRHPFHHSQLDILLRNVGRRLPLAVTYLKVERSNGDSELRGIMHLTPFIYWSSGRAIVDQTIPDTVLLALKGRPFTDFIDHPYIPRGLLIGEACPEKGSNRYIVRPKA